MRDEAEELFQALANATGEKRSDALRVLRGEAQLGQEKEVTGERVEPLLTQRETAAKLNVHPTTLYRWQVPSLELGGRPRYRMSSVLAYIESSQFKKRMEVLRTERKTRKAA